MMDGKCPHERKCEWCKWYHFTTWGWPFKCPYCHGRGWVCGGKEME